MLAPNWCVQLKNLFSDSSSNSICGWVCKAKYFDCVNWFGASAISLFKMVNFLKNQGRFHGRRTVFLLCVFVLGHFKAVKMSFKGFSLHLILRPM